MFTRLLVLALIVGVFLVPIKAMAEISTYTTSPDDRLNNAVSETNTLLDDATRVNIKTKCIKAQTTLIRIQEESDVTIRSRIVTYSDIQRDLQTIKLRMIKQGTDASESDLLTGKIQQLLDQFTLYANKYGVSLSDVIGVDCVNKPEQFKAGLVIMRTDRAQLLQSANALKQLIQTSRVSIFNQLKKRLSV